MYITDILNDDDVDVLFKRWKGFDKRWLHAS